MRKDTPTPLVLVALVVVGAAIMAGLAARDSFTSEPADERSAEQRDRPPAPRRERLAFDPALEPAVRYALAARNWTPATYTRSWSRQLALTGGRYRRELAAQRPPRAELAALRADRARSEAKLVRVERDSRMRDPAARVLVTLEEQTRAAGQEIDGQTVNEVRLRRLGGRWRVVGWSVLPGGASGGGL